ncbi:transcription regulatory protein SNF2 [Actinidia rufa]|uniref:Transcription regulatory protein SNF2 n=1 Tax=Actinidia rufa TaxID=165716 RepID=A0A7J0F1J3_9ERIC|nr:transcription regulatory protein SNF2 [Actinidia rufa]
MQSGGGTQQGHGGHGRSTAAAGPPSSSASPSSSSSAVSTPHLGFDSIQQYQQQQRQTLMLSVQSLQQQLLRKPEGNEAILAYQAGGLHGLLGGGNFTSSSGVMQLPQQSKNNLSSNMLSRQPNRNQPRGCNHSSKQKMGMMGPLSGKDQNTRMGNLKMQELMSIQDANQAHASSSQKQPEHFGRAEKQTEQSQPVVSDQRSNPKPPIQPTSMGHLMQSNAVRPIQAPQAQQNIHNNANSQIAMNAQIQAMQALARCLHMQKANENNMGAQSSPSSMPKQQVASPQIARESSPHQNSSSDMSGQSGSSKARQTVAPGPFGTTSNATTVNNVNNITAQQRPASGRENQVHPRQTMLIGNGMPPMHPPQPPLNLNQGLDRSSHSKSMSTGPETLQMQHSRQVNRPSPQAAASTSDGSLGNSVSSQGGVVPQMHQQRAGFTKQQLHVLKAQILAFRRLKKGDATLPQELLRAIAPPPLETQLQQVPLPTGTRTQDRSVVENAEARVKQLEARNDHIPVKPEPEVERSNQKTPFRSDLTVDRGKAVAPQVAVSETLQAKKPLQASNAPQPKDDLLLEEGMEVLTKKRTENLRKISGLLAVNLERKRIRPDLVLRLQIEEKKLRLMDRQARLRDEVDQQQQEIMAMPDRPYRKFVRLCERQRMDLTRQVQASQKAMREKQLKTIFQWRKKLLEAHWMEALKNNDVERYREMLLEQQTSIPGEAAERYNVLSSFLTQTEEYLQKLGSKITATKNQQEGLSEEEVRAAAACAGDEVTIRNRFSEMNAPKDSITILHMPVNERVTRQPSMLRAGTLRDYQLVGLQWMLSLYNNKLNGILADEMGLGKTVQVMALIAYLMEFKGNYGPHLIIVPNAVLVNWKSEFHNWLPSVSCIFYVGVKDQRSKLFSQEVCAMKFNVLVTTYEFIMYDRSKLAKVDWKYIIIDEAQRMKDRESVLARDLDRYRCQRRLLLTGTPLQNDLKELWSLLNLLLPEVFDNRKAFHDWFSKPFQREGPTHSAEDDWLETEKKVIIIHRLHQILEPFMLRRRVEDVEGSLPPKISIVLKCRMSAIQSSIYDWIKTTGTLRVDPEDEKRRVQKNPMYQPKTYKPLNNRCMELRKVCNHPLLTYPYFSDLSKDFLVRSCGKLWIMDRILIKLQRTGHRVLLFSTMTKLLDLLEEYLQWRRLVYRRIDGTTSLEDRESAIVDFNSPGTDCFIFLLSIRAAGRGSLCGSIESLIRNNIQQYKIDMADEVINAGRFDQRTTHEERRLTLETLLHDEERYQDTVHDVPSLQEVNRMIARSEEEVELFDQMDEEFDWEEEMTRYDQVPKWIRASTREVNATVASLSKKPSKNTLLGGGIGMESSEMNPDLTEKRRGRPKGRKFPNYRELDDDNGEFSEASSEERNEYSAQEEEEDIGDFEEEEFTGAMGTAPVNKDQSEEEGPVGTGGYDCPRASENTRHDHGVEEAGSSGSSSDSQRSTQMPDELEEGEIALSGDSHVDLQQSGSWIQDRDEGEDEQVLQPKIRRKRSIRLRPRLTNTTERQEDKYPKEKPKLHLGDSSQLPFQVDRKYELQFVNDSEPRTPGEPNVLKHDQYWIPYPAPAPAPAPSGDAGEHSRGSWDGKVMNSSGTSNDGRKMSDVIQRRCKNVISKFQKRIDKEGPQIVPLLTDLWKRIENSIYLSGHANNLLDLRKIDQRIERFEYNGVMELVFDVQFMLKGAMQYFGFSHEIAFPDTDFREARNALSFASSVATSTPAPSVRQPVAGQSKRHKPINEVELDPSPPQKPRSVPSGEDARLTRSHMPPNESRIGSSKEQQDDLRFLTHPGELVVCKRKRNDREKSALKPGNGSTGPGSPRSVGRSTRSPGQGAIPKETRSSQRFALQQPPQQVNGGSGIVGWANPVKRLRTDAGKRRPSHL